MNYQTITQKNSGMSIRKTECIKSTKLVNWSIIEIMDETWLKELNKRNLATEGEGSSKLKFATVFVSSSVLNKLSQEEQAKFEMTEFQRATNEIEHWARVEEVCEFFGLEDPELAGDIYLRSFKSLTREEECRWLDLRDVSDDIPDGFGVKVDWR
ncbi:hypothetical protein [Prochlorococcus marinus]|uniref:Uncharacterized protein n=1 Tax=Prochlorococcus marinus XMU1408 TaxID=2213228 RepID=A0A318R5K1_PROMR|nr:hypothetical protein [Prochlorococcus marinus]MBW3041040.1 hypothetical protein [Prochlorococcus marinus str. XMU1408]PYE03659.1 hypothetical protein DNJ73_00265 [Prochlorococcus marinus XMU1408]